MFVQPTLDKVDDVGAPEAVHGFTAELCICALDNVRASNSVDYVHALDAVDYVRLPSCTLPISLHSV